MGTFDNKTVVVTGGSRGIGLAVSRAFLAQGARVVFCGRTRDRVAEALQALKPEGEVAGQVVDVSNPEQVKQFIGAVEAKVAPIDILINNAGVLSAARFAEESLESIDDAIDTNLKGVLYASRVILPLMLSRRSGVIINVANGKTKATFADRAVYYAAKSGVIAFTESLAKEIGSRGVRVYGMCPGEVVTDMQEQYSGGRVGLYPEVAAQKFIQLAGNNPPIKPGECATIP